MKWELSIMLLFGDSGAGIPRKKLRLNLDLLQLKWFFNCIFGFSTLEKNLGRFDCAETSYQTCDSSYLLPDFNRKKPLEKLSKSRVKDNCLINTIFYD